VCGATDAESLVRIGFMAAGATVPALPLPRTTGLFGLAFTVSGGYMAMSRSARHEVAVYRVSDGCFVRAFGGLGADPGRFNHPAGLCITRHNTLLVAEYSNSRIQEVSLEGSHVKFFHTHALLVCVAAHGDVVATAGTGEYGQYDDPESIHIMDYASGECLRQFGRFGTVSALQFSADGSHLLIVDTWKRVTLATTEGVFVRRIGKETLRQEEPVCVNALFSATDDVVVAEAGSGRMHVFSHSDGGLLRTWKYCGGAPPVCPTMATLRHRLYVFGAFGVNFQVFE